MTTKTDITPLPCPFCGGNNIVNSFVETYSTDSSYDVFGCEDCGARFEDGNVEMWNRRSAVEADRQGRMPSDEDLDDLSDEFHGYSGNHTRDGYLIPKFNYIGYARALLSKYGSQHD